MGFNKMPEANNPSAVCPECLTSHLPTAPHNLDSIYYNCVFYGVHNRWPTWADAVSHCSYLSNIHSQPVDFAVTRFT